MDPIFGTWNKKEGYAFPHTLDISLPFLVTHDAFVRSQEVQGQVVEVQPFQAPEPET